MLLFSDYPPMPVGAGWLLFFFPKTYVCAKLFFFQKKIQQPPRKPARKPAGWEPNSNPTKEVSVQAPTGQ
jgi:hypothetical protein